MAERTALLAAGGTGGHIWPAVAVARVLESRGWACHFVAGDRSVEAEVYRAAGVEPTVFPVPPPSGGRWRTYLAMVPTLVKARALIRRLGPHAILATGGYVSAPVALAGALGGIPTALLEPNSVPGRVTRRLARWVDAVAVADEAAGRRLRARRIEVTGNPQAWRREDLDRFAARAKLGIRPEAACLLIAGGSQGARAVNALVRDVLAGWCAGNPPARPVDVIWVAGSQNLEGMRGAASQSEAVRVQVHGHLVPFHEALAAADLAVSRAGAGAVADLALAGVPSVLFPLPIALDDHQRANARRLVETEGAVIFDERGQTAVELDALLRALLENPARLAAMGEQARSVAQPEAAERVAALLAALARR